MDLGGTRALSPVVANTLLVGVVVLVAVPVVLLGLSFAGVFASDVPVASFETETVDGNVSIVHVAGDPLAVSDLEIRRGDTTLSVASLVETDQLVASDAISFPPRASEDIRLVWTDSEDSTVLYTVDAYTVTRRFWFVGERAQTMDVSNVDSVDITLDGAGGESAGYAEGANGGAVTATVAVDSVQTLDIYVGASPQSTPAAPEGGWGWKEGGEPLAGGGSFVGGGGGGASAILVGGSPVIVADGGGGGADFDTFTFYAGGGGARGGNGGPVWFGGSAGDGAGSGDGGDGAGGTVGGDPDSFVPATPGGGSVLTPSRVSESTVTVGGGAAPDTNASVAVTYTVD